MDDLPGHGLQAYTDGKILYTALGLRTPVSVRRDFDFAHGIMFDAVIHFLPPNDSREGRDKSLPCKTY
jgi:hypothetical protein